MQHKATHNLYVYTDIQRKLSVHKQPWSEVEQRSAMTELMGDELGLSAM